jgi:hypothetical protein
VAEPVIDEAGGRRAEEEPPEAIGEVAAASTPAGAIGPPASEVASTPADEESSSSAAGSTAALPSRDLARYAPDPAGTRPKVPAVGAGASASFARAGGLGQTFRVSPPPPGGTSAGPAPAPVVLAATVDDPAGEPGESPHAPRFQFILGALLALGLSAIAITAYTLGSGRDPAPIPWSSWHPTASGVDAATQIANHVAPQYRQPTTGQLLAVKGGPLALAGIPVTLAIQTGASTAAGGTSVLSGSAILYQMCGLGPGCSIVGKASAERLMLVRREALELALYTFQYIGADQVVVFLPPVVRTTPVTGQPKKVKLTTDPTNAVFFRSSDLASELSHPLAASLTGQTPSVSTVDAAPDTTLVNELTSPAFYKFSFIQNNQDNSLFLLLQPSAFGH